MDNLGSHKGDAVRSAIKAAGARLLFLPPHPNPDLNPIEHMFSELKHPLRKAKERTFEATCQRISSLFEMFTSQECVNYFANSGYGDV